MKARIIGLGKISSPYLVSGIEEYKKRLSRFVKLENVKEAELKNPMIIFYIGEFKAGIKGGVKNPSEDILEITSPELAESISSFMLEGHSSMDILLEIKEHKGNNKEKANANYKLKEYNQESKILRVALCHGITDREQGWLLIHEQLYRAFTILNNIQYHK